MLLQAWTRSSSSSPTRTWRSTRRRSTSSSTTLGWTRRTPSWCPKWTPPTSSSSSQPPTRTCPWGGTASKLNIERDWCRKLLLPPTTTKLLYLKLRDFLLLTSMDFYRVDIGGISLDGNDLKIDCCSIFFKVDSAIIIIKVYWFSRFKNK